jgi:hypothetical protein
MSFQEQHRPSGGEARPLDGNRSREVLTDEDFDMPIAIDREIESCIHPGVDHRRALERNRHGRTPYSSDGHPVYASAPRFRSSLPITTRWISDVPSQMRSTRSSRYNRSTGCSRM